MIERGRNRAYYLRYNSCNTEQGKPVQSMNPQIFYRGVSLRYMMAPLPTLALARLIVRNFRQDGFSLIIVDGNLRVGKSAYAMRARSD